MTTTAREALTSTREELDAARRTLAAHEAAADRGERVDPSDVATVRELVGLTERRVSVLTEQADAEQLEEEQAAWTAERARRLGVVATATDAVNDETATVRDAVHRLVLATTVLSEAQREVHAMASVPGARGALVSGGVIRPALVPNIPAPSPEALVSAALSDALASTSLRATATATDARSAAAAL